MDLIGCPMEADDFVVSGSCSEQMYGMCESLWRPDLVSDLCSVLMLYLPGQVQHCVLRITVSVISFACTVPLCTHTSSFTFEGLHSLVCSACCVRLHTPATASE